MQIRTIASTLLGLAVHMTGAHATSPQPAVESVTHHLAPCFAKAQTVNCEVSGVARVGDNLVLVNDKQMPTPGSPSVFTMALENLRISGEPAYLDSAVLRRADKYEALTTTLDGRFVIASTAFSKEGSEQSPQLDALNTLVYWPVDAPQSAKVIEPYTRGGITSSRGLRDKIAKAIGAPYFQVEALTTVPGDKLLLGIRKYGQDSKAAHFSFLVLSIPLSQRDDSLVLGDEFSIVSNFTSAELAQRLELAEGPLSELGLSGLEYDRYAKDRLYAVTSYESGGTLGGFLWVLPLDGESVAAPLPVKLEDGAPLRFVNKPEGVEVLDQRHVLVVHDDDRIKVSQPGTTSVRDDHEFWYSLITFEAAP